MFESEKQKTGVEVGKMLDRLEKRVEKGNETKDTAEQTIGKVVEATVLAKQILAKVDFEKEPAEKIADITNAWKAWETTGFFKGTDVPADLRADLALLLNRTDQLLPASLKRFARQIWRTEMVAFITQKLSKAQRADRSEVLEKVMASQIVTESEDDPMEALTISMRLDPAISEKSARIALAESMAGSQFSGGLAEILQGADPEKAVVKIVVGGELLEIPPNLCGALRFKHGARDGNRIYAQMENGCRGNLVIIEPGPVQTELPPEQPPVIEPPPEETGPPEPPPPEVTPPPAPEPEPLEIPLQFYEHIDPKTHATLVRLNPNNHWLEWTDEFYKLTPDAQNETMLRVSGELYQKLPVEIKQHLIVIQGELGKPHNLDALLARINNKGNAASDSEKELLKNLNGTLLTAKNAQLISFFDTWCGARFEKRHTDKKEQAKFDDLQIVLAHLQNALQKPENIGKTLVELAKESMGQGPTVTAILLFQNAWKEFIKEPSIADFYAVRQFGEMEKKSNSAWLELAKTYRKQGNKWFGAQTEGFEQSEAILRSMLASKNNAVLNAKQESEINDETEKKITREHVRKTLVERGMLNSEFWKARGYATENDFVENIVEFSRKEMKQKLAFELAAEKEDNFDLSDPTIREAFATYQDLTGIGGGWRNLSDSTVNFLTKEAIINTALFAVSGGVANIALRGGIWAARAARIAEAADRVAGMGRVGRFGVAGLRTAAQLGVQGAAFAGVETGFTQLAYGPTAWDNYWQHAGMSTVMFGAFGAGNWAMRRAAGRFGFLGPVGPTVQVPGRIPGISGSMAPGIADIPVGAARAFGVAGAAGGGVLNRIGQGAAYIGRGELRLGLDAGLMTTLNTVIGGEELSPEQFAKNWYLLHFLWAPHAPEKAAPPEKWPMPVPTKKYPKPIDWRGPGMPKKPKLLGTGEKTPPKSPEPIQPKAPEPAPPKPPEPAPAKEPQPLERSLSAHNVDWIASAVAKRRGVNFEGGVNDPGFRIPQGKVTLGEGAAARQIDVRNILRLKMGDKTIRQWYEEAGRMPDGEVGSAQRQAKIERHMELDRMLASRLIIAGKGIVQYPIRSQAEGAKEALERQYPNRIFTITEVEISTPAGPQRVFYLHVGKGYINYHASLEHWKKTFLGKEIDAKFNDPAIRTIEDIRRAVSPEVKAGILNHVLKHIDAKIEQGKRLAAKDEGVAVEARSLATVLGQEAQGRRYQFVASASEGKIVSAQEIGKMRIDEFLRKYLDYDLKNDQSRKADLEKYTNMIDIDGAAPPVIQGTSMKSPEPPMEEPAFGEMPPEDFAEAIGRAQASKFQAEVAQTAKEALGAAGVDVRAYHISENRDALSQEALELKAGERTLRELYEEATGDLARLSKVDRLAAERVMFQNRETVEYPSMEQAKNAHEALTKDFPNRIVTLTEKNGRGYIRGFEGHDVNFIAHLLSENRYNAGVSGKNGGIPAETVRIGEKNVPADLQLKAGEKTLQEQYENALKIEPETERAGELARLDRVLASRLIIQDGGLVEYPTREQADLAKQGMSQDHPDRAYFIIDKNGKSYLGEFPKGSSEPTIGEGQDVKKKE